MNEITLQVGVKVLLQNKEGKYLLIRRNPDKYPEVGAKWDIVGGRIDPGTALLENLKREVKEETGLEIVGVPRLVMAQDILRIPGKHIVRLTYIGESSGEVILDTEENDIYKWHIREELDKVDSLDIYFKEILEQKII
jgi:8-oxo-dGTP diphosphatase